MITLSAISVSIAGILKSAVESDVVSLSLELESVDVEDEDEELPVVELELEDEPLAVPVEV
jgi:hypothetical protein|tara:strand:- start:353 stop:535 length:183 start_codon:yes stop_codon:yes gene_type:complete